VYEFAPTRGCSTVSYVAWSPWDPHRTRKELEHPGNEGLAAAVSLLSAVKSKHTALSFAGASLLAVTAFSLLTRICAFAWTLCMANRRRLPPTDWQVFIQTRACTVHSACRKS